MYNLFNLKKIILAPRMIWCNKFIELFLGDYVFTALQTERRFSLDDPWNFCILIKINKFAYGRIWSLHRKVGISSEFFLVCTCRFNCMYIIYKSRNQFMVSSILPKNERNSLSWASSILRIVSSVCFFELNWRHHNLLSRLSDL